MIVSGNNNASKKTNNSNLNKKPNLINNEIKLQEFTLIDEDGSNLGEVKRAYALSLAAEKDLDLVLISNNQSKPVCKIMDYGKYLYDQKRKQKDNKKKQAKIKIKEVKIKPQIADNDLSWNAKHVVEWLNDGNVVRILVVTPGRLSTKEELILEVYRKLLSLLDDSYTIKSPLKKISSFFYEAIIEPKKGK